MTSSGLTSGTLTDAQAGLELRLRGQYEREKHALEQQVESLRVQLQGIGQRRSGKYKDDVGTGTCTDCPAGKYRERRSRSMEVTELIWH